MLHPMVHRPVCQVCYKTLHHVPFWAEWNSIVCFVNANAKINTLTYLTLDGASPYGPHGPQQGGEKKHLVFLFSFNCIDLVTFITPSWWSIPNTTRGNHARFVNLTRIIIPIQNQFDTLVNFSLAESSVFGPQPARPGLYSTSARS